MTELSVAARPLAVIEAELDLLERDTRAKETSLLGNYIEVGRRLEEAKAQLPHGQWGPWLEARGYPQAKAGKLMKVFRAYGKEQQDLFGCEPRSDAFAGLGFQKLVQLLSIEDGEEREEFVAEHDVAAMSTRELEKALRERARALEEAEKARADVRGAEEARAKMEADMKAANASLADQRASAEKYKGEAEELRRELKELKNRPIEVAVETREPSEEASARVRELERRLAVSDAEAAAFKVFFEAWQEDYQKMADRLRRIADRDPDKAGKLREAVRAAAGRMLA